MKKVCFYLVIVFLLNTVSIAGTTNHIDRISVGEFEEVAANSPLYKYLKSLDEKNKADAELTMKVLTVELLYKINVNLTKLLDMKKHEIIPDCSRLSS